METTAISIDIGTFLTFVFSIVVLAINAPIAWLLHRVNQEQRQLTQELNDLVQDTQAIDHRLNEQHYQLREQVQRDFVRKEDLAPQLQRIEHMLSEIFDKLDGKADKEVLR